MYARARAFVFALFTQALVTAALALSSVAVSAQAPAASASAAVSSATAASQPAVAAASAPGTASAGEPGGGGENPYGIQALWNGSDAIARGVLVLLAIMSAGSWYIMVVKLLDQSRMQRHARAIDDKFWTAPSVSAGASALERGSAYRFIADSGIRAMAEHDGLKRHIPMNEWIPMAITGAVDRVHASTQAGLAFLATVGSTAPFVGLFGTVWGIYHALTAIGISGQASIDKVAGPVGEALIMTAVGLAVAIPAVLGYNWLTRRNTRLMDQVREFSDELNAVILGSRGKAA